jgi:hypothetical protein
MFRILLFLSGICSETEVSEQLYSGKNKKRIFLSFLTPRRLARLAGIR